mgnify:CR=1 FL=1
MKDIAFTSADGFTPVSPSGGTLVPILGGATDTPVKFGVRSSGDEAWTSALKSRIVQVGASVGNARLRIALDTATLSPPWGVVGVVTGSGGSWGTLAIYTAVVTALNATGQTVASVEASATITDAAQTITWGWSAVPGATSYKVYRRASAGTYATPSLLGETSGLELADTGAALSAGAPPAANTTAGAAPGYGTPPAMGYGPASIGALAVGQWAFVWVSRVVPSGVQTSHPFGGLKFTET